MSIDIRRARWPDDEWALKQVRETVFVHEQGVPLAMEWDGRDTEALHLLALDANGQAVGTARMLTDGHIGRMAVLAKARGQGIGTRLLKNLLEIAGENGYPLPFLSAQTQAIAFYQRLGFQPIGPVYMEAGIPHQRMQYSGAGTT